MVLIAAAGEQPVAVRPRDRPLLVAAHLPGRHVAGAAELAHPAHRRRHANLELRRRRAGRQARLHCLAHPSTQIHRIRPRHPCWPPPTQQAESDPHRVAQSPKPYRIGLNTSRSKRGKDAIAEAVGNAREAHAPAGAPPKESRGFEMRAGGLYRKPSDPEEKPLWICSPFEVVAETRHLGASAFGLLLEWVDRYGEKRSGVFARESFSDDMPGVRSRLAHHGLTLNGKLAARQALMEYLNICSSSNWARTVSRTGWHRIGASHVFVLPNHVIWRGIRTGRAPDGRCSGDLFGIAGTLEGWREEVGRRCCGNSRLIFAVSCAFAAPLLGLAGEEGGGFNLLGFSRIAKTTALRVAASVCGGAPGGGAADYIRQWRTTDNALEPLVVSHSDMLTCLDEMSLIDARRAGEIAYRLANGRAKLRASRSGTGRPEARFRVLFLSTGEVGLADKNHEAGLATRACPAPRIRRGAWDRA